MALRRLTDRVLVETQHLGSNNGIVEGGDGTLALVDAPHRPTDAIAWARTVAEHGDARWLINTDHHPDHTIGNRWLGGTVVAHERTRARLVEEPPTLEYLRDLLAVIDAEAVPLLDDYEVRLPEITFSERAELFVGDLRLELLHQPGHTANTILVHVPSEGVLFSGDNVCELGLPSFQDSSLPNFFDAIDRVESLDWDLLVPGHGEVSGRDVLDRYRSQGRQVVADVAAAQDRGESREQAVAEIRFEDLIHVGVGGAPGYPESLIEHFQARSIGQVFDDLRTHPSLRDR